MARIRLTKKDVFGGSNVIWAHDSECNYRINATGYIQVYNYIDNTEDVLNFDRVELDNKSIMYSFLKKNQSVLRLRQINNGKFEN